MSATLTKWPTLDDLASVRAKFEPAFNAIDRLHVTYHVLGGDADPEEIAAEMPPLDSATIAHVLRFADDLDSDVEHLKRWAEEMNEWPRMLARVQYEQEQLERRRAS